MPRASFSRRAYVSLAEFRYRIRAFLAWSDERAREAGVEPGQHQLLLAIAGMPEGVRPTIGAVAERLVVRHHSAVGLAARAEEAGLVERHRDEVDRREVTLAITRKGERVLDALSHDHRAELATHAPALAKTLRALSAPRKKKRKNDE